MKTVTVFGKKIKKKTVGTGMVLTLATTAIGAFYAAKRGKVINNGKEAGFFSNLGEGLKSIFTKEGRQNYEFAQKAVENTASTAGKIEEAADNVTSAATESAVEKPVSAKTEELVQEAENTSKPARKGKKKKIKHKPAPAPQAPSLGQNPPAVKDVSEPNFARLDAIDPELQAMERAGINKPKKGLFARLFGGKKAPAAIEGSTKQTPVSAANSPLANLSDTGKSNLPEVNFARLDAIDPELNRVDGTKYVEKKKSGPLGFLKKTLMRRL